MYNVLVKAEKICDFYHNIDLTEEEVDTQISVIKDRLRSELFLDPDELDFDYFRDEKFGSGVLLIDTSGHDLAEFIYEFLVSTSGSLDLSNSNQSLSPVPYGSEIYSFKRLPRFLNTYFTTVIVMADLRMELHLLYMEKKWSLEVFGTRS